MKGNITKGGGNSQGEPGVVYEVTGIDPTWTDWAYFSCGNNRNSLVSKLRFNDTSNGETFENMFDCCDELAEIPLFDTSNGTVFASMFYGCSKLKTVPQFNLGNAITVQSMFYQCIGLEEVPELNTYNANNFNATFSGCTNLIKIDGIDISKATDVGSMFNGCTKLTTISNLIIGDNRVRFPSFINCVALESLVITGSLVLNASFSKCKNLSKASIISVINALSLDASATTLTLSQTAVNTAFETSAGAADGSTSGEWTALIATKPSWTISLV